MVDNQPIRNTMPMAFALLGGLLAAALDIAYAIIFFGFRGVSAQRILQSVASGMLGPRAYEGGSATALLGLALHFALMLVIALIFFIAARRIRWLTERPYLAGAVYGVIVYWTMNLVVVPLSASHASFTWHPVIVPAGLLVHIVLIGMPIAWAVRVGLATKTAS